MKRYIILLLVIVFISVPENVGAKIEGYEVVAKLNKENISLYAKEMNGLYHDFKINFKGEIYF